MFALLARVHVQLALGPQHNVLHVSQASTSLEQHACPLVPLGMSGHPRRMLVSDAIQNVQYVPPLIQEYVSPVKQTTSFLATNAIRTVQLGTRKMLEILSAP
jgi:hypothetical protein